MDRLDELSLLVAIVDGGSLAAGARRTKRSPAAVTRILSEFESRIGVRLIERTTRRIAPTEAGRRLVEHARKVIESYDEAMCDVSGEAKTPVGMLRITAPLVFGRQHIAPIVADFLAAYPQVQVDLILSNAIVDLRENEIDVALRIGRLNDSALIAKPVGQVRHLIVSSPEYIERRGRPGSIEDLQDHEIVVQSTGDAVTEWQFQVPGRGVVRLRPHARFTVNQAETAIEAACAGRGLIRVLSYQVVTKIEAGELVPVLREFEMEPVPVSLVFASARFVPLRLRLFLDFATLALRGCAAFRRVKDEP